MVSGREERGGRECCWLVRTYQLLSETVAIGGEMWEGGREVMVIPSCNSIQLFCLGLYNK